MFPWYGIHRHSTRSIFVGRVRQPPSLKSWFTEVILLMSPIVVDWGVKLAWTFSSESVFGDQRWSVLIILVLFLWHHCYCVSPVSLHWSWLRGRSSKWKRFSCAIIIVKAWGRLRTIMKNKNVLVFGFLCVWWTATDDLCLHGLYLVPNMDVCMICIYVCGSRHNRLRTGDQRWMRSVIYDTICAFLFIFPVYYYTPEIIQPIFTKKYNNWKYSPVWGLCILNYFHRRWILCNLAHLLKRR